MLEAALKNRLLLYGAALPLLLVGYLALNNWQPRFGMHRSADESTPIVSTEQLQKALAEDRRKLQQFEKAQAELRAEVIRLRKAHQEGRVDRSLMLEAENSFVAALKQVHELRHSVTEADIALTEAILG